MRKLAQNNFQINLSALTKEEQAMCLMLHYDISDEERQYPSIEESIKALGSNEVLRIEIIELMEYLIDRINYMEREIELPYPQPLKVHSRYTRDQILAAFGFSSFEKKSSAREGVAYSEEKNTELLFITLNKSDKDFSPTTMYEDFAMSDTLFHWQSQNSARPDKGKGLSYIEHKKTYKKILLFVREQALDKYGNTMGYVFVGEGNLSDYYGSKPMSITWKLKEPLPAYLWKDTAKMAVG